MTISQILLNEARTEVDVELNERHLAGVLEAENLAGLDHQNVSGGGFELQSVHDPRPAALLNELNLVVWMAVRSRSGARQPAEKKRRHVYIAVLGADEVV